MLNMFGYVRVGTGPKLSVDTARTVLVIPTTVIAPRMMAMIMVASFKAPSTNPSGS
jgi:hypothetical protein